MTVDHRIRVLIASRYGLFRIGLRALLENSMVFRVMGEANTTRQTVTLAKRLHPDVLIVDAGSRGLSAPDVSRLVKEAGLNLKIVVLTSTEEQVEDCLSAGASACVRKSARSESLKTAVYNACKGRTFAA